MWTRVSMDVTKPLKRKVEKEGGNWLWVEFKYEHQPTEMGLWTLLEGCLLIANAFAILNEERFLAPRGWSFQEYSGVKRNSFKGQLLGLIYATQYLRVPLMLLNILCIVVKLVSG
nr:immediate early response 3-interacting protein 1-like [Ipomoea batatas]